MSGRPICGRREACRCACEYMHHAQWMVMRPPLSSILLASCFYSRTAKPIEDRRKRPRMCDQIEQGKGNRRKQNLHRTLRRMLMCAVRPPLPLSQPFCKPPAPWCGRRQPRAVDMPTPIRCAHLYAVLLRLLSNARDYDTTPPEGKDTGMLQQPKKKMVPG